MLIVEAGLFQLSKLLDCLDELGRSVGCSNQGPSLPSLLFRACNPTDKAQAYLTNLLGILQVCQDLLLKQRLSRTGQRACAWRALGTGGLYSPSCRELRFSRKYRGWTLLGRTPLLGEPAPRIPLVLRFV